MQGVDLNPVVKHSLQRSVGSGLGASALVYDTTARHHDQLIGMQQILRKIPGVRRTEAGYIGGLTPNPDYTAVSTGKTGYAEADV